MIATVQQINDLGWEGKKKLFMTFFELPSRTTVLQPATVSDGLMKITLFKNATSVHFYI